MQWIDRAVVLFLIFVFGYTGLDKLFHYQGFINALNNYQLVPHGWGAFLAMPVIALELTVAVGLIVKSWRSMAALLAALTMSVFTIAVVTNFFYGERGICGCWFTLTLASSTEGHLLLNAMIIAMSLIVWWDSRQGEKTSMDVEDIGWLQAPRT